MLNQVLPLRLLRFSQILTSMRPIRNEFAGSFFLSIQLLMLMENLFAPFTVPEQTVFRFDAGDIADVTLREWPGGHSKT